MPDPDRNCNSRFKKWRTRAAERLDVPEDDPRLDDWLPKIPVGGRDLREEAHPQLRDLYCDYDPGWGVEGVRTGRCKNHGGNSAAGPASGKWKDGRKSKYVPRGVFDRVAEIEEQGNEPGLERERAILRARRNELLDEIEALEEEETGEGLAGPWEMVEEARDTMLRARRADGERSAELLTEAFRTLERGLDLGVRLTDLWAETRQVVQEIRKVENTEIRRRKAEQEMIDQTRALALITWMTQRWAEAVREHAEPDVARNILKVGSESIRLLYGERREVESGEPAGEQ